MQPIYFLNPADMQQIMRQADRWLGGSIDKLTALPYVNYFKALGVFNVGVEPINFSMPLNITAIFMTLTLLFIIGLIVAYLFFGCLGR